MYIVYYVSFKMGPGAVIPVASVPKQNERILFPA